MGMAFFHNPSIHSNRSFNTQHRVLTLAPDVAYELYIACKSNMQGHSLGISCRLNTVQPGPY